MNQNIFIRIVGYSLLEKEILYCKVITKITGKKEGGRVHKMTEITPLQKEYSRICRYGGWKYIWIKMKANHSANTFTI